MVKDRVVPDPQEIVQADPLGGRPVAVPVKKTVVRGLDHRPGDKKSEDQERRGQKEKAGFYLARTPKVPEPPPAIRIGSSYSFRTGGSRQLLFLPVSSHRRSLFNAGWRGIKGEAMGDCRGIETVLGVQGEAADQNFRAGAMNPTGWLMGCQNRCGVQRRCFVLKILKTLNLVIIWSIEHVI
jgi:hypothetical protein